MLFGYEANFVNPVEVHHQCPICHLTLREPLQTGCGHRICSGCYKQLQFERGTDDIECPVDKTIVPKDEVFPDVCAKREILNLQTFCKYRDGGCQWKGALREYENHVGSCEFEEIECPNGCLQIIPKCNLKKHMKESCPLRQVSCEYCKDVLQKSNMEKHYDICDFYPEDCPFNCGEMKIPRNKLEEHIKSCPNAEGCCAFSFAGCKFKGKIPEVEKHLESQTKEHLMMSAKHAVKLEAKNTELNNKLEKETKRAIDLEQKLDDQKDKLEKTQEMLHEIQKDVNFLEDKIGELKQNGERCEHSLGVLSRKAGPSMVNQVKDLKLKAKQMESEVQRMVQKFNEVEQSSVQGFTSSAGPMSLPTGKVSSNEDLEKRTERFETQLASQDVQIADLNFKLQLLEATSYNGVLVWKIDNYHRRKHDAVMGKTSSLYSPPFYTSRFGYKMCARIYLNGDGQGKGSHVSLFFVVMKSEYDALLKWPFPCKITMKLLAQDDNANVVESFRPDPNSSSFRRPSADMNIASGCPLFVSQSKVANGSYVKKDSIFIEVIVDTSLVPCF